jgi:hypothetical protein
MKQYVENIIYRNFNDLFSFFKLGMNNQKYAEYQYIYKSMNKNKNIIKKIKKYKLSHFLFNYLDDHLYKHDLKYIHQHFNKAKNYKELIQVNGNYSKGILPTFIKMAHLTYYKHQLKKSFFKVDVQFFNEEMLIIKQDKTLFINFRGTMSYKQIEILQDLSIYKTQFYLPEHIYEDFTFWKSNLMKKYSIEEVLGKQFISDRFLFHKGFLELYEAYKIKKKVLKIIEKNINTINTIFLNGHSLGGGFANLLTLDLYQFYEKKKMLSKIHINIITFGTPGNMNSNCSLFFYYLIQKKFINKYIRVINKKDVISSTFSDKTYFFTKIFGILRHANASIPLNKKDIIMNNDQKCLKKFIIIDTQKNLKPFLKKNEQIDLKDIHELFCFSSSKDAYLFSI